jgi:hypothetical protein
MVRTTPGAPTLATGPVAPILIFVAAPRRRASRLRNVALARNQERWHRGVKYSPRTVGVQKSQDLPTFSGSSLQCHESGASQSPCMRSKPVDSRVKSRFVRISSTERKSPAHSSGGRASRTASMPSSSQRESKVLTMKRSQRCCIDASGKT